MGLFDILKGKKRKADKKLKRPSKGVLKSSEIKPDKALKSEAVKEEKKEKAGAKESKSELASKIILSPHITEKTTLFSERGVYTFRVSPRANKIMVKKAIADMYGFEPRKIRITNMPSKVRSLRKGKKGVRPGYKKAEVYLKEGDKIEIA